MTLPLTPRTKHISAIRRRDLDRATRFNQLFFPVVNPVADPTDDIPDRYDSVSPLHIVCLEPFVAV
jgi:hypothetical protein